MKKIKNQELSKKNKIKEIIIIIWWKLYYFILFWRSFANHKNFFPEYMPLDFVKKGLENGELIEGNIRISQKCNSEAYVPSPVKK